MTDCLTQYSCLAGNEPVLDAVQSQNEVEMYDVAEQTTLHSMAKIDNLGNMWFGSQSLGHAQEESSPKQKHLTAIGYIVDLRDIVKVC